MANKKLVKILSKVYDVPQKFVEDILTDQDVLIDDEIERAEREVVE